jgi:nucleoside-diphosphate kinase
MDKERTLAIIKPNTVQNKHVGEVFTAIERGGFAILDMRMERLTDDKVKGFYAEHIDKPFFADLQAYMLEGPVILIVLERDDAVAQWRTLIGATDPAKAAPGTLRRLYGEGIDRNAFHGSDSPEAAKREIAFFFPSLD